MKDAFGVSKGLPSALRAGKPASEYAAYRVAAHEWGRAAGAARAGGRPFQAHQGAVVGRANKTWMRAVKRRPE